MYAPSEAVVTLRTAPVLVRIAFTVALGIADPVGSVTVPVICPVSVCARKAVANNTENITTKSSIVQRKAFIFLLPAREHYTVRSHFGPRESKFLKRKFLIGAIRSQWAALERPILASVDKHELPAEEVNHGTYNTWILWETALFCRERRVDNDGLYACFPKAQEQIYLPLCHEVSEFAADSRCQK